MLKIGITGGIGSGKTTVCKLFELFKIPVFFADYEAKALMHKDAELIERIKSAFGNDVYNNIGALDRGRLARLVFNDEEKLKQLNSLVHPAVFNAFDAWAKRQKAPYVLKEAALLFESGSYKSCDFTVLVKSPLELRISRVMKRDSVSRDEVLKRVDRQLSDGEKEKLASYVINNDEQQLLVPQILELHQFFLKKAERLNDT